VVIMLTLSTVYCVFEHHSGVMVIMLTLSTVYCVFEHRSGVMVIMLYTIYCTQGEHDDHYT
jgi:hypothetical protein